VSLEKDSMIAEQREQPGPSGLPSGNDRSEAEGAVSVSVRELACIE
jgi:hypothetical protein